MTPQGTQTTQQSAQSQNALARLLVQAQSIDMLQQIYSQTFVPANQNGPITLPPRYVGLTKGFWVQVVATFTNTDKAAATLNLTNFGPANILSQLKFTDLNNNDRVQTAGWHVALVNAVKSRRPYGSAIITGATPGTGNTGYDTPIGFGSNFNVISAPASIAATKSGTVTMWYWLPLAYSESDFRGAIYLNVVNATAQISLTLNPTPIAVAGTDDTLAVYNTSSTATFDSVTVTVFQSYLDQLPVGQNRQPVLPMLDLSTIYELKQTAVTAVVPGQDFPIQYANFRDFLSTIAVYFNGTARVAGGDINYWALQAANFTSIWKIPPSLIALRTRNHLSTDMPLGTYYFGSRQKPISTTQYGNQELVLNAITAGAGNYVLVGYEDFALVNALTMAGSLPGS